MKKVRFWAVLAIGFMSVMSLKAQSQRMSEFQNEFGKYQNQYRDLMHIGKHKDAMAPSGMGATLKIVVVSSITIQLASGASASLCFPLCISSQYCV